VIRSQLVKIRPNKRNRSRNKLRRPCPNSPSSTSKPLKRCTNRVMPGFLAALLLFASCVPAHSKLLRAPVLRWEVQLPSPMRRGNAVVYVGSERLAATTSDGSLHVLNATDGSFLFTFSLQDEEVLTCETGVSLWKDRYAVYAVYRPISDTSTVIAVDMDTGSERWLALLAGRVAGTPMAGSNAIFVPHNIQEREGRVSVITSNDEENARIYKSFPEDRVIRVVGPGAVHTVDGRDVFVFAQSRNGGYSPSGFLYMLYQEINAGVAEEEDIINATNRTTAPFRYTMKTVSSGLRSSVSRPALSANLDVALTQQGSTLSAWAGSRDLSTLFYGDDDTMLPRWEKLLDTSNTNGDARKSIQVQCILSSPPATQQSLLLLLSQKMEEKCSRLVLTETCIALTQKMEICFGQPGGGAKSLLHLCWLKSLTKDTMPRISWR